MKLFQIMMVSVGLLTSIQASAFLTFYDTNYKPTVFYTTKSVTKPISSEGKETQVTTLKIIQKTCVNYETTLSLKACAELSGETIEHTPKTLWTLVLASARYSGVLSQQELDIALQTTQETEERFTSVAKLNSLFPKAEETVIAATAIEIAALDKTGDLVMLVTGLKEKEEIIRNILTVSLKEFVKTSMTLNQTRSTLKHDKVKVSTLSAQLSIQSGKIKKARENHQKLTQEIKIIKTNGKLIRRIITLNQLIATHGTRTKTLNPKLVQLSKLMKAITSTEESVFKILSENRIQEEDATDFEKIGVKVLALITQHKLTHNALEVMISKDQNNIDAIGNRPSTSTLWTSSLPKRKNHYDPEFNFTAVSSTDSLVILLLNKEVNSSSVGENTLIALDKFTGKEMWRTDIKTTNNSPYPYDIELYLTQKHAVIFLYSELQGYNDYERKYSFFTYDLSNGKKIWHKNNEIPNFDTSIRLNDQFVFINHYSTRSPNSDDEKNWVRYELNNGQHDTNADIVLPDFISQEATETHSQYIVSDKGLGAMLKLIARLK